MIYIVERSSNDKNKPCKEAVKRPFYNVINGKGKNHWSIELNTLEDLNEFIKKYGKIVISNDYEEFVNSKWILYTNTPHILIYDTYIE